MSVAKTIYQQIGGQKFATMTGSKNFIDTGNGLRMNLTKNKVSAKILLITLNSMDTYDLEFYSYTREYVKIPKKEVKNVYFDQLQEVFTQITGLYTKF